MERDHTNSDILRTFIISTHTLTWSVTNAPKNTLVLIDISTHTLTWSVTLVAFNRFIVC